MEELEIPMPGGKGEPFIHLFIHSSMQSLILDKGRGRERMRECERERER